MRFGILTHATHKIYDQKIYAYEPYVREMNLWLKNVEETRIVAPYSKNVILPIETAYTTNYIALTKIPGFNILNFINVITTLFKLPYIIICIFRLFYWAEHIHIRCPGNIGLLGTIVQVFFPFKKKTVKYAGNWDPNSKQPFSYRLQKSILSNTFLTRNCKVLVYGEWEHQTKNIVPFFTASYSNKEITKIDTKSVTEPIKVLYVGSLTQNKRPLLTVNAVHQLIKKGYNIVLNIYGDGPEFEKIESYIVKNSLQEQVFLNGNQSKEIIKSAYQESHFLIFISKSEGWPKVVAEAMFWGCLPIVSEVSCVPYMIDTNKRGSLVGNSVDEIVHAVTTYLKDEAYYQESVKRAQKWSRQFTLDKFALEISHFIKN